MVAHMTVMQQSRVHIWHLSDSGIPGLAVTCDDAALWPLRLAEVPRVNEMPKKHGKQILRRKVQFKMMDQFIRAQYTCTCIF